jgi:hypothetical protein
VKCAGMFGVLINVGSNSSNPNGRGRVFGDLTFEYLPIPESEQTAERVLTYGELGFNSVKFPNLPVHLDPEFETFTYGHVRRGFGDVGTLLRLREDQNGVLFFYSTLQKENDWFPYIIGYFRNLRIHDCRRLAKEELRKLKSEGFSNNAHMKRIDPSVDFLIRGGEGSGLLKTAFLLSANGDRSVLRESLKNTILTATGKKIKKGKPWFRWTMLTSKADELLHEATNQGIC